MNIAVFGAGYVGLVQGAVLSDAGHNVTCIDIDEGRIENLKQAIIPIYEPGLKSLIKENHSLARLHFTTNAKNAVEENEIIFIAVGTPPEEDGSADLKHVMAVAKIIATYLNDYKVVVNKSTVPVGTADKVTHKIKQILSKRSGTFAYDVISNPEFLKEGAAVNDCKRPDRIIIGTASEKAEAVMRELYGSTFGHQTSSKCTPN